MRDTATRKLLLSIHDVTPRFDATVERLHDRLCRLTGTNRMAMLVVPDHWGEAPLANDPRFGAKLRAWADQGVEMFLHGWFHRDDSRHAGAGASFKAKHMTAGEGEFLGLSREEAQRRLSDGRKLVEDVIGRPIAGFVAPAWLYGEGAKAALRDEGFAMAEDHFRVWRPRDGAVLARGPVISWASRSRNRRLSSLGFAALARTALKPLPVVRIALHPGDANYQSLLDSIDRTVKSFARSHFPARYGDLACAA
jgi:predicted deacetylase